MRTSSFSAEDVLEAFADATRLPRASFSVEWLDPRGFSFSDRIKERARKRRWYLENRDAILEANRTRRRNDPEHARAISRRFHSRNRDARNAWHRDYYQRNAEQLREYSRNYHAAKLARAKVAPTTPPLGEE